MVSRFLNRPSRRMEPSSEGGYTLTTENPTINGTTDNAPRRTTEGSENLNVDWLSPMMSSVKTRPYGPVKLPIDNTFKKIDAGKEALETVVTTAEKVTEINDATNSNEKAPDTLIKTGDAVNKFKLIYTNMWKVKV